jgi:hypothetical protein
VLLASLHDLPAVDALGGHGIHGSGKVLADCGTYFALRPAATVKEV